MPKVLTPEECKQLLAKAAGKRIERVFRLILGLGLRRQEAQALHWEDIDGERRVVVIRRKLKTPRARREIPLPSKLLTWLLPEVGTHVLQTNAGEPYSSQGLATMLARFKRDAKLPFDVTLRICRATYGSFLVGQGFEIAEVSRFLGHSSVSLTERWYYGLRPSKFAKRVDEAFTDGLL